MKQDFEKSVVDLDSAKTSYWTYNPHGTTTIVMVHGFRGTHDGLEDIIRELPHDYRVIVPDLPGFGASLPLKNNSHDMHGYVAFLHDFFQYLALETPPILFGHSFGSTITAYYAAAYPSSITKLILANPIAAPALDASPAFFAKLTVFYYWLGNILPHILGRPLLDSKLIILFSSMMLVKSKDKSVRRRVHQRHLDHFATFQTRRALSESFKASTDTTVADVATRLNMPTLLIAGDSDDIIPLREQHRLKAILPQGKLTVIDDVGHLIHYETPAAVAQEVTSFVREE